MKNKIIEGIGCIALAFAFVGCAHPPKTVRKDTPATVTISISRGGTIAVAGEQCRPSELDARIAALAAKQQTGVVVSADSGAPFQQVAAVMHACEAAGLRHVSLANAK